MVQPEAPTEETISFLSEYQSLIVVSLLIVLILLLLFLAFAFGAGYTCKQVDGLLTNKFKCVLEWRTEPPIQTFPIPNKLPNITFKPLDGSHG